MSAFKLVRQSQQSTPKEEIRCGSQAIKLKKPSILQVEMPAQVPFESEVTLVSKVTMDKQVSAHRVDSCDEETSKEHTFDIRRNSITCSEHSNQTQSAVNPKFSVHTRPTQRPIWRGSPQSKKTGLQFPVATTSVENNPAATNISVKQAKAII